MLYGRQLIYSPNTTWTVVRNLTVLWSTADKINRISNRFWDRWRHEYIVNLCGKQRRLKLNINFSKINVNNGASLWWKGTQILLEHCHSRRVLPNRDSEIREAIVKITKTNTILKHPINKLFTIENIYHDTNQTDKAREQKLRQKATVLRELKYEC